MTAKSSSAKSEPTTRFVAFLRGINVGGKNIIKMEVLRDTLAQAGYGFYRWDDADAGQPHQPGIIRLVCGWDTEAADVDALLATAR